MLAALLIGFGLVLAQAEPAPVAPPAAAEPPPSPANALGVFGRFGYRMGSEGNQLGPSGGFSIGGSFERRYARGVGPGIDLAVGVDFFHDQFSSNVVGSAPDAQGVEVAIQGQRMLTQTSFSALHTLSVPLSKVRLWAAAGVGLTMAYFSTPELALRPGATNAVQPMARAGIGVDVTIKSDTGVCVRADYTHTLTRPEFTTESGQTLSLFGDLFDLGAGLFYRF